MSRTQRPSNNQPQTFSLLKNIQIEEEIRRNKQSNYYAELRNQIQQEKQQKKRKKQEQARKQRQEQQKIRRDNQALRQRAEIQRMQEIKKKGPQQYSNIPTNDKSTSRINMQQSLSVQKRRQNKQQNYRTLNDNGQNYNSRLRTTQSQKDPNQLPMMGYQSLSQLSKKFGPYSMSQLPTYANRMQNESFNFLPQRKYMDSYFQELLGQKRKFQQQANGIYELNRIFYQQKSRIGMTQSKGLSELKKLQTMLDQKGADYMASYSNIKNYHQYDQYDSLKKLTIPSFEKSRLNQSGWRKLD